MRILKNTETAGILFLFFICFNFVSCKSTEQTTDASQSKIQDELDGLSISLDQPKKYSRDQQLFIDIKNTSDFVKIGDELDYKITVDDEAKEVILLFEDSNGDEDWRLNYLFFAWPLKLDGHIVWTSYGYAKQYGSAKDVPFNEFYEKVEAHPDYKVIIRGWSLGSAMAKIAARQFAIRAPKDKLIDELTTYGDVKCWYNLFYSVKKRCKVIREYVNANDYITWCLPFCRRDVTCRVGDRFNFKKVKNGFYLHEHYEDCDYSKWNVSNSAITSEESDRNSK